MEIERELLTRRTTRYSQRLAVVVRFNRSRGRYERQGIPAEPASIERAEQECAENAGECAEARRHAAEARVRADAVFAEQMAERIREKVDEILDSWCWLAAPC